MKIGDYVYAVDSYDNYIEGTITKFDVSNDRKTYAVINTNPGTRGIPIDNVFSSSKKRDSIVKQRNKIQKNKYKEQMKTMRDIVVFCLEHCVANGEEYTDWEARKAVEERLQELTDK